MLGKKELVPTKSDLPPIFWHGVVDLAKLEEKLSAEMCASLWLKLESGLFKSLSIEEKHVVGDYPVYGMRLNNTIRVLATEFEVDGKKYLLTLDVLLTHDYHKSRFMTSEVLKKFIEKNRAYLENYIRTQERLRAEARLKDTSSASVSHLYKSFELHHDRIISLSAEQSVLLGHHRLLFVNGGPGSGKSVVAVSLLDSLLSSSTTAEETFAYVTQSPALVKQTKNEWDAQPHINPYGKKVVFCTYESLVKDYLHLADDAFVGKAEFLKWMDAHYKQGANKKEECLRALIEKHGKAKLSELLYQEMRLLSGYNSERYASKEGLATIPSSFSNVEIRQWIVRMYAQYQAHLKSTKKEDAAFIEPKRLEGMRTFDYLTLDEGQDFSTAQLHVLFKRRKHPNQLACFYDPDQNITDNASNTRYLAELVDKKDSLHHAVLKGSYRCPKAVIEFANAVLGLKIGLVRGKMDKFQQHVLELTPEQAADAEKQAGTLQWVSSLESIQNKDEFLAAIKGSADVLVVTTARHRKEAGELFKNNLIVLIDDIQQVKGLQFSK